MASYSVATTALALGIERKRLENILLRCRVPGTNVGRQGRTRRLPRTTLLAVTVMVELQDRLAIPAAVAAALACRLLENEQPDSGVAGVQLGALTLSLDQIRLEHELTRRLAEALESAPRPKRGRPRVKRVASSPPPTIPAPDIG